MENKKRLALHTLGCKLNFTETSSIGRMLTDEGYEIVAFDDSADLYIINTCSVTDNADKKCRSFIRKAKKQNLAAFIIVVGCYAQLKPKEISEIPGVDLVLGAAEKFNIVEHLKELEATAVKDENAGITESLGKYVSSDVCEADIFVQAYSINERTRSFLKVQDGCDYNCSFCTIPLARGKSRSASIATVLANANEIAEQGIREIVLTGVNIGDFGKGTSGGKKKEEQFIDLIKELDKLEGIDRFRISSIEPNLLSNEIIEFVAGSKRFMPHFHIPLQSGSDKLLAMMRRRYRKDLYIERVQKIKSLMPDSCIGVDVIVGFPGETEEDFLETYNFLKDLDVSYLHVFTYSERKNTLAIELDNPVPQKERARRSKMLRDLSAKKRRYFNEQFVGEIRPVLFEQKIENGFITGFSDNYIKVQVPVSDSVNELLFNKITEVKLGAVGSDNTVKSVVCLETASTI